MRDSGRGGHTARARHLIESSNTSEDDVGVLHLDDSLAQPHQVCTDPDGATGHLDTHTRTREVTVSHGERAAAQPGSTGRRMLCRGLHSQVMPAHLLHPIIPLRVTLKASRRQGRSGARKGPRGHTMLMVTISS